MSRSRIANVPLAKGAARLERKVTPFYPYTENDNTVFDIDVVATLITEFIPNDLFRAATACHAWKRIARPIVYATACESGLEFLGDIGVARLGQLAQRIPKFTQGLRLNLGSPFVGETDLDLVCCMLLAAPTLTKVELNVAGCLVSEESVATVAVSLPKTVKDLSLTFDSGAIGANGIYALTELPKSIEILKLGFGKSAFSIGCDGIAHLGKVIAGLNNLKSLSIDFVGKQVIDVSPLMAKLPKDLTHLNLNFGACMILHLHTLAGCLAEMDVLEELSLAIRFNPLVVVLPIAQALPRSLKKLALRAHSCGITDLDMQALAANMPKGLTELRLDVWKGSVTTAGVKALAEAMPRHLELLEFKIDACRELSRKSAAVFKAALPPTLRSLDIHVPQWSVQDVVPPSVTELQLSVSSFSVESAEELGAKLPSSVRDVSVRVGEALACSQASAIAAQAQGSTARRVRVEFTTQVPKKNAQPRKEHRAQKVEEYTAVLARSGAFSRLTVNGAKNLTRVFSEGLACVDAVTLSKCKVDWSASRALRTVQMMQFDQCVIADAAQKALPESVAMRGCR